MASPSRGIALSALVLGEPVEGLQVAGVVAILAGIVIPAASLRRRSDIGEGRGAGCRARRPRLPRGALARSAPPLIALDDLGARTARRVAVGRTRARSAAARLRLGSYTESHLDGTRSAHAFRTEAHDEGNCRGKERHKCIAATAADANSESANPTPVPARAVL
ncbi:MAG: hypothetical protein ACLT98_14175 [Eggerthellaceae bacterium]